MPSTRDTSTLYVSQATGSDERCNGLSPTENGSGDGPFATLTHALATVRELRACGVKRPLHILLTDDYLLDAPLLIDRTLTDLTLDSLGNRKKLIGGLRISGWRVDRFRGVPCFSARLPEREDAERWAFTDLFVNGRRASVTRYPKEGTLRIVSSDCGEISEPSQVDLFGFPSRCFTLDKEDVAELTCIEDAILHYYHYWIDEHTPIASYDRESGRLTTEYVSRFSATALHDAGHPSSVNYYLTNVPNTFQKENEWYLDRSAGVVYYIPEDINSDPKELVAYAPMLDHLIDLRSRDVRIRNLELTCTVGDYASTTPHASGLDPTVRYGGDIQSVCWAPGAIRLQDAVRCSVSDCYIHGVGIHGIEIRCGCSDIRVEGNLIKDVCAGGIKIFGGAADERSERRTHNCTLRGNEIADCGVRYEAGCGILVIHASCNEISCNEIHNAGYTGISVGWVWGYAPSSTYGNVIRGNHIYQIGRGVLSDLGGIYLLGEQHGTCVAENRIHDVTAKHYGGWGIYLDEGSSFITVERNAVYRTKDECFHLHYGAQNTVRNNIFVAEGTACVKVTREEAHNALLLEQNLFLTNGRAIYEKDPSAKAVRFRQNLFWDVSGSACPPFAGEPEPSADGILRKTETLVADPALADLAAHDFTLPEHSPALSLGFRPLPESVASQKRRPLRSY